MKKEKTIHIDDKELLPIFSTSVLPIQAYVGIDSYCSKCKEKYVICTRDLCCGCAVCVNICPTDALRMVPDEEGFLYPEYTDNHHCINCGLCEKRCPVLNRKNVKDREPVSVYAAYDLKRTSRYMSTSGGVANVIADFYVGTENICYGAAYGDKFTIKHIRADCKEDIEKIRQSKYCQSEIGKVYRSVKKDLENGKDVVFFGMPCQCAGLKMFLNKEYQQLLIVDLLCHSVSSPAAFKAYCKDLENIYGKTVSNVWFKNKELGWNSFSVRVDFFESKEYYRQVNWEDPYFTGFLQHLVFQRPSCHKCAFRGNKRVSDITLADFWGIRWNNPEFDDTEMKDGVSAVLINTKKAQNIFDKIKERLYTEEHVLNDVTEASQYFYKSPEPGQYRDFFWEYIEKAPFSEVIETISQDKQKREKVMEDERYYFSNVISDYEKGRAQYPKELFDTIKEFGCLGKECSLLEVGAGPGTATKGFLGYSIDLLEISREQVDFLNQYFSNYRIKAYQSTFEDYQTEKKYDLIYSATAFHLVDQNIAYEKAAYLLNNGGTLAAFGNLFGVSKVDMEEVDLLQRITRRFFSGCAAMYDEDYIDTMAYDFVVSFIASGWFEFPVCRRYKWEETYNAEKYLSLIRSLQSEYGFADSRKWGEYTKEIEAAFERFGGDIVIPQKGFLVMAKKKYHYEDNSCQFIEMQRNIPFSVELDLLSRNPDFAANHFLKYADEVLYITKNGKLYGVITPRDLINYLDGKNKTMINRNFRCLEKPDISEAKIIFQRIPNIHEVVVLEDGSISGVIKTTKRKSVREWRMLRKEIMQCLGVIPASLGVLGKYCADDLFTSLTQSEQETLLSNLMDMETVRLFEVEHPY